MEPDGIAKLVTVNGNMSFSSYETIMANLRDDVSNLLVKEEYITTKYQIYPDQISLAVGTGVLSSDRTTLYHDNSSLAQASGGGLLNSKNQVMGE